MKFTIKEAIALIEKHFAHLDLDKLEGIEYADNTKYKFNLDFGKGRYKLQINLDDTTYKLIG